MWFTESGTNDIGQFTNSGFHEYPVSCGVPCSLGAITVGPDGALWFINNYGRAIGRITTAGVVTEYPVSIYGPSGITVGPDARCGLANTPAR